MNRITDNRSKYFLQADEIDHLTIRYTDKGEKLSTEKGAEMLLFYNFCYPEVSAALEGNEITKEALSKLGEDEIYRLLVITREALLDTAFGDKGSGT